MSYSSKLIDIEGTRAAERALYANDGVVRHFDMDGDIPIADILGESAPTNVIRLKPRRTYALQAPPTPVAERPAPMLTADAGQIETILRSAPQICANCRHLSNEEGTCPSPRGHYFVTDYTAMAQKIRTMFG